MYNSDRTLFSFLKWKVPLAGDHLFEYAQVFLLHKLGKDVIGLGSGFFQFGLNGFLVGHGFHAVKLAKNLANEAKGVNASRDIFFITGCKKTKIIPI